jgi:hypothetical protein
MLSYVYFSFYGSVICLESRAHFYRIASWPNRFRRLLRRWENIENYLALLKRAFVYIAFRAAEVFG